MIPCYRLEQWFTAKQNKYMEQCDLIATMTVNTICCMLYKYELADKKSEELERIVDECTETIRRYDVYKNAQAMRQLIEEVLDKSFIRKS